MLYADVFIKKKKTRSMFSFCRYDVAVSTQLLVGCLVCARIPPGPVYPADPADPADHVPRLRVNAVGQPANHVTIGDYFRFTPREKPKRVRDARVRCVTRASTLGEGPHLLNEGARCFICPLFGPGASYVLNDHMLIPFNQPSKLV